MRPPRQRELGFVVSAELLRLAVILVIGLLVGTVAIRDAVLAELHDLAESIGEVDSSYLFQGVTDTGTGASTQGTNFRDRRDHGNPRPNDVTQGKAGRAGDNRIVRFSVRPGNSEGQQRPLP